jgi:hypothetical protein
MRNPLVRFVGVLLAAGVFFSCASRPDFRIPEGDMLPQKAVIAIEPENRPARAPVSPPQLNPAERPAHAPAASPQLSPAERPTERPASPPPERQPPVPDIPVQIQGSGSIALGDLASFLYTTNPDADSGFVRDLATAYIEEAAAEGINHDIAFAQMCLETGFLRFGNLVTPDMNNFCGLGAIGPEQRGEQFPTPRIGVRAHIQHLKAYATEEPLYQELVDPRYRYVRRGAAPTIDGLAGTWAVDREYAAKIKQILERLYLFSSGVKTS